MAVAVTDAVSDVGAARRVSAWHFVRLKLRVMGNNFRGQNWRVGLFVLGAFLGLWLAAFGFSIFAAPGLAGNDQYATLLAAMGGGLLVLCWLLLPLVFFGVDETLDPARFALLPLPRRTLAVVGLFVPVILNLGNASLTGGGGTPESPSPVLATLSMVLVGVLTATTLANQFGFDGSAYATHVVVGIPGAEELRARIAASSLYDPPPCSPAACPRCSRTTSPGWRCPR